MRSSLRKALGLAILLVGPGVATPCLAQQPKEARPDDTPKNDGHRSVALRKINEKFDQQHQDVEKQRLEALAELAHGQSGEEAETTYQHLFSRAIVDGRVEDAEPAASAYLQSQTGQPKTRVLAAFIATFAAVSRDQDDQAVQVMQDFLKGSDTRKVDASLLFSLGESFLQRLILDGKFDVAKRTCQLLIDGPFDKDMKAQFQSQLNRLKMLGKPAPAIAGLDIDGEAVSLADLKGKVVLVEFWASWCPPCLADIPRLNALHDRYRDQGFEILGVNVDAKREGSNPEEVRSTVRSLLIEFLVPWRVVLNGPGDNDFADRYGVTEIPASFLIDQEGQVAQVELTTATIDQAVAKLLGVEAEPTSTGAANPAAEPTQPLPEAKAPRRQD